MRYACDVVVNARVQLGDECIEIALPQNGQQDRGIPAGQPFVVPDHLVPAFEAWAGPSPMSASVSSWTRQSGRLPGLRRLDDDD